MLILLITSHCKMCTLPKIQSRVFVLFATDRHARLYCWQWKHFTMGPKAIFFFFSVLGRFFSQNQCERELKKKKKSKKKSKDSHIGLKIIIFIIRNPCIHSVGY